MSHLRPETSPLPHRPSPVRHSGLAILLLALSLILVACGNQAADTVELSITTETSYEEPLSELIGEYEAEHDVTFNVTFADTEQVQNVTRTQLTSGQAGDIIHLWPGAGNPMAVEVVGPAGYAEDISDFEYFQELPETLMPLFESEGERLMISPGQAVIGGLYNANVWEQLDQGYPETWDDLLDICQAADEQGVDAMALGIADPVPTQFIPYSLVPSTVYAENSEFDEDMQAGEATFADSGWQDAMEKYLELDAHGCFSDDPLGTPPDEATELVMGGEALMTIAPVVGLPFMEEEYDLEGQLGVMPIPAQDDPDTLWVPSGPSSGWGLNADSDHPEEARAFLEWISEPDQLQRLSDGTGLIPAIVDEDVETHQGFDPFLPYLQDEVAVPFMDSRWPNPEVQQALFVGVQEMFIGSTDVEQVLTNMDEAYAEGVEEPEFEDQEEVEEEDG